MKIVSQAQLAMFQKAAANPDYAKSRGIAQSLAQDHLDAHKKAGSPMLPDRVVSLTSQKTKSSAPTPPKLLQSTRD